MIENWSVDDQVAHLAEITSRRHWTVVHLSLIDQIPLNPVLLGLISNLVSLRANMKIIAYLAVSAQRFSFVCVHGLGIIKHPLVSNTTNVVFK
jgi:hypothetical protein